MKKDDYDSLTCTVLCHQDIGITPRKGILGLIGLPGLMCYLPTGSQIRQREECYTRNSLDAITELLQPGEFAKAHAITPDMNGNIMVRMYYSKDHQFLALRLHQYVDFEYRPISSAEVFTGEIASDILSVLLR